MHFSPAAATAAFAARLDALARAAATGCGPRAVDDIRRLSASFTTDRARRTTDYMADPALRSAYLAFFVPQYAAKLALLLQRHAQEGLVPLWKKPRILDVGAGPLTGFFAAHLFSGDVGESVAVDLARKSMDAGAALAQSLSLPVPKLVTQNIAAPLSLWTPAEACAGPFDLIVVAHVLNEMGDPRRTLEKRSDLLANLVKKLAPHGRLLLVEPGTRVYGRALMALRDSLAHRRDVSILAPCRGAALCPLLQTPGDWCHGELSWHRPPAFAELETKVGLKKDVLKESHLLLARREEPTPTQGWRLVGGLMGSQTPGRYACTARGLVTLQASLRLPKEVAQADRGALVVTLSPGVVETSTKGKSGERTQMIRSTPRGRRRRNRRKNRGRV